MMSRAYTDRTLSAGRRHGEGEDWPPVPPYAEAKTAKSLKLHANDCLKGWIKEQVFACSSTAAQTMEKRFPSAGN